MSVNNIHTSFLNKPSRIYLIGMMGAGKSTLGRKIASLLGYAFIDLDDEIEKLEGSAISSIFEQNGESYFRKKEAEVLRSVKQQKCLIATGGGTPCYENNMIYMLEQGITVYIRAKNGLLFQRVSHNKDKRPLLKGMNEEAIRRFLEEKVLEREPFYLQAHYVFDIPASSPISIVKSMLSEN